MITTLKEFYTTAEPYVDVFDACARTHALEASVSADHICYKCGSHESFEYMKSLFEFESDYIFQSVISGRSIAYIKMKRGIETALGIVHFLELSDQKPDGSSHEGFDHIEVYPTSGTYAQLIATLAKTVEVQEVERPHHTTHDVVLENGFIFRCEREPLLHKIKREEMV